MVVNLLPISHSHGSQVSNRPIFPSAVHQLSRTLEANPPPSLPSGEDVSGLCAYPPPLELHLLQASLPLL